MACEYGDIATVKMMLDKGADYNEYDWHEKSLVMIAYGHRHTEIVKMFLQRGADFKSCDSWR
ncbi:Hypothetical predicted protein [Mytilus galloprovincialis]|uniref:Uncharacterized protein n=1 Tax=Mytilus galloprovincialis TaxID=29158 RepID=A0A8B6HSQ5_MYTGA|nr:Hypothetical predicted protein [Mytilus galloprovincialis]